MQEGTKEIFYPRNLLIVHIEQNIETIKELVWSKYVLSHSLLSSNTLTFKTPEVFQ